MSKIKEVISNKQFRDILVCIMWPSTINYASGILARQAGNDMWISGIIGLLIVLPFLLIIIYIGRNFPNKTIVEYSQDLLGSAFGKILGFVLAIYMFISATSAISMYIHHLTDFLLPQTPFLVVASLHIFVICYLVWNGIEVIGRTSVIAFWMAIVFFILVYMASISEINIGRITPFFDSGFMSVFSAGIETDTFIGMFPIVAAIIMPMVHDQKKVLTASISALLLGGFFFVSYFVVELMVMGPRVVSIMRIASMDFVRCIEITKYLHRFESFMVGLWYWSILIQAGTLTFCSLETFVQTVKIKKNKLIIVALGLIMIFFTYYVGRDRVFFLYLREYVWHYFSIPIDFGVPLILLLALVIKK